MLNTTTDTTNPTDTAILTDDEVDAIVNAESARMSYVEEELRTFISHFDMLADALYKEEAELLV